MDMKKIIALVTALVLVCCCTVTAFAASPVAEGTITVTEEAAKTGIVVTKTEQAAPTVEEIAKVIESVKIPTTVSETATDSEKKAAADVKVLAVVDIKDTDGTIDGSYTIQVAGLTKANFKGLLHYEGGAWVLVSNAKVTADGTLTFSVNSFSPFAIVTDSTVTAAATGEATSIAYIAGAIVMAAAAVVCFSKSKKNA